MCACLELLFFIKGGPSGAACLLPGVPGQAGPPGVRLAPVPAARRPATSGRQAAGNHGGAARDDLVTGRAAIT